ncbi:unnamed protein product [Toxocara canis]|uniref:Uncharacterized protein n=1 Tax=Toxocara canis TaxID=6265 RepID=A0A183UQ30_TOXCA|nr:unnamed protein product [Toxocara canis]
MSAIAWIRRLSHENVETPLVIPPIYMHNCDESSSSSSSTQRDARHSESCTGTPRRRIFAKSWDSARRRLSLPGYAHRHELGLVLHAHRHVGDDSPNKQQQDIGSLPNLVEVMSPKFVMLMLA